MAKKSRYKTEIAEAACFSMSTLQYELNTRLFDKLEPLGYKKDSKILRGKVLQLVLEELCIDEEDFLQA